MEFNRFCRRPQKGTADCSAERGHNGKRAKSRVRAPSCTWRFETAADRQAVIRESRFSTWKKKSGACLSILSIIGTSCADGTPLWHSCYSFFLVFCVFVQREDSINRIWHAILSGSLFFVQSLFRFPVSAPVRVSLIGPSAGDWHWRWHFPSTPAIGTPLLFCSLVMDKASITRYAWYVHQVTRGLVPDGSCWTARSTTGTGDSRYFPFLYPAWRGTGSECFRQHRL